MGSQCVSLEREGSSLHERRREGVEESGGDTVEEEKSREESAGSDVHLQEGGGQPLLLSASLLASALEAPSTRQSEPGEARQSQ
jgi:hypothetical protein